MTDYYKQSLEHLRIVLLENQYDFWANWLSEDIENWEKTKSTEHHLRAYGGMGSFNDVVIGNQDSAGLWQGQVFGMLQSLAYGLASGEVLEDILARNNTTSTQISGWRCQDCGAARINSIDIERFLCVSVLPQIFANYLKNNRLIELLNTNKLISSEDISNRKTAIERLFGQSNIEITSENNWLWTCPKCGSEKVCSYRWEILNNETKIIESDDNLEIKGQK
ncbi:hypothetical protein [Emticicia sp. W12TSBA100-4]|uniref:DUF6966 domain-containing protein n=1 Tax=Emticicia sp. W12TSBA100-4 TaxID=3160965 RepID=UPI0033065747